MTVVVRCPNPDCRANSTVVNSLRGNTVTCKKCGKRFVVHPTESGEGAQAKRHTPSSTATPFPILPTDFGRYKVLKLLGQGGMGAVYLAEDSQLGRSVALKIPFFDAAKSPRRVARFVREAQSAAILHHPNICTVFDVGEINGQPFITMAYIAGTSLEDLIDPESPMAQAHAAELTSKIALALEHAHQKGIIHRDLKPANIMISTDGEPVIMDFGLAKRSTSIDSNEAKLTRAGGILGTPSYMSPEQVKGDDKSTGPTTDIYSLGVILFEMLTGRTPYGGNVGVVLGQILAAAVPPVSEFRRDVDPRLDVICQKAMAKEPSARFQSMQELAEALTLFVTPGGMPLRRSAEMPSSTKAPAQVGNTLFDDFADDAAHRTSNKGKQPAQRWSSELRRNSIVLAGVATVVAVLLALFVMNAPTANTTRTATVNGSPEEQHRNVAIPDPPKPVQSEVKEKPLPSSLSTEFVLVRKGKSWLGGNGGTPGSVEVEVPDDFYLGTTEVTQDEWEKVMGGNPSHFSRRGDGRDAVRRLSDEYLKRCPVEMVSWKECQEFIRRLNDNERSTGWIYRLPTEAEWEYACRGGPLSDRADSAFDFYFEPPANILLPEQASVAGREKRTSKVASYQAGRLGLYNMHDNVHEWCSNEVPRPKDSPGETLRVIRGGSWWSPPAFCKAVARFIEEPTSQRYNVGLRLVRVQGSPPASSQ